MPYIYSTASNDCDFVVWSGLVSASAHADGRTQAVQPAVKQSFIRVKGRANVIDQKTLVTPQGAVTEVSDDELKQLRLHDLFRERETLGFYSVQQRKKDPAKVIADMKPRDDSAQWDADRVNEEIKKRAELKDLKQKKGSPDMVVVLEDAKR